MAENQHKTLALATILTAFVASLCCIGPLLFAAAGLGVFGAATIFSSLRPYLLVIAGALLAAGFYYTYRSREVVCEDGTCKKVTAGKRAKLLLWFTTALVLVFIFSPYFTRFLLPKVSESSVTAAQTPSNQTVAFRVEGMTCGGCVASVESALKNVNGVKQANVDLDTKMAKVTFDPSKTNREALAEAVKKVGFTPVL
jgi:mercuric ion transport protein